MPTAAAAPGKTAVVGPFVGSADDAVKNYIPASFIRTMKKYGIAGERSAQPMDDLAKTGSIICADTGASYLIGGRVAISSADASNFWVIATVTLNAFDCSNLQGPVVSITLTGEQADRQRAVDIAVDRVLKKYFAH